MPFIRSLMTQGFKTTAIAVGVYAILFIVLSFHKYATFGYDGLDLAIFTNVLWHTVHGNVFGMTIHPHSYLGDHFEPILLAIAPFFAMVKDPRTLLTLQTLALASAALPLYRIAEHHIQTAVRTKPKLAYIPLVVSLAWLLNPIVHHANLYEFHTIPFAMPFLMLAMLGYLREDKKLFLIAVGLSLIVREDIALIIASFGLLAMLDKKSTWWRIVPIATGMVWFIVALTIIGIFAPEGSSKFMVYYAWLGGDTMGGILLGALTSPLKILRHIASLGTLEWFIGLMLPLAFLPLIAPKRLILGVAPAIILALGAPGLSGVITQTHYGLFFLPALFFAGIPALMGVVLYPASISRRITDGRVMLAVFGIATLYTAVALGPIPHATMAIITREHRAERLAGNAAINEIPKSASVGASYRLLPHLATRNTIYASHYMGLGVTQFGEQPYAPQPKPAYMAWDERDALHYAVQFPNTRWAMPYMAGIRERLAPYDGVIKAQHGSYIVIRSGQWNPARNIVGPLRMEREVGTEDATMLLGIRPNVTETAIDIPTEWMIGVGEPWDRTVEVTLINAKGRAQAKTEFAVMPTLGVRMTKDRHMVRIASFQKATIPEGAYTVRIQLIHEQGLLVLGKTGTSERHISQSTVIGEWLTESFTISK